MTTTPRRMKPEDRKQAILTAAVNLAQLDGFLSINRDKVARVASVSPGLVTAYFYCTEELRRAVMLEAIRLGIASIVAEGLAARCPIAAGAPLELRQAAIAGLGVGV
jgi:DNA-binding transcriptional regulator YbjK